MDFLTAFKNKIFSGNFHDFESASLDLFRYQAKNNEVYSSFIQYLCPDISKINRIDQIPFLPVEFFKNHKVLCKGFKEKMIFESSGTVGTIPSKHYISHPETYDKSLLASFSHFVGNPKEFVILALLPSYIERNNASLVYMVNRLSEQGGHPENAFYLNDMDGLKEKINKLKSAGEKIVLFAVTFALLEFIERAHPDLQDVIIIETGGMKGRGRELPRPELYDLLATQAQANYIYSEYGMTELQSQAYSVKDGLFKTPPWMKTIIRDPYDPVTLLPEGQGGCINIIDLANVTSCAFIATQDTGILHPDGSFEVSGRTDHSEMRGCNLLVSW